MKILFFINRVASKGGSERVTVQLANALVALNYEVVILTWMGGVKSFYKLDNKIKVDCLYEKDVPIYSYYLPTLLKYSSKINQYKPDVIIDVCTALSLFSVPLRLFGKFKLISWEHFNTTVNWNFFTPRLARYLASKYTNALVVLTEMDKNSFVEKFKPKRIEVIPNPITVNASEKALMGHKLVLAVGRLTHQKGFDLLLNSWHLIFKRYPNWKLAIVGEGEDENSLKDLTAKLELGESVNFYGATNQVEKYFLQASIFVLSSRFEGLPLVLIEAKAFGLPVVSYNCPTGPEDIVVDGFDGYLVEPNNISFFADALTKLMDSEELRVKFSEFALKDSERFKLEPILEKWVNLIGKL